MRSLRTQPIRRQIVAITLLLVGPVAAAMTWAALRSRQERETELSAQAGTVAVTAAAYLNQYLTAFDSTASVLIRHPAVIAQDRDRCDALFASLLREQPLLINIVLTDPDGRVKGTGLPARGDLGLVAMSYVRDVVSRRKPVVSELTTGQVSGKPTIVFGYPVLAENGAVAGVLALGVNLRGLQTVFGSIPLPEGSVITLTDSASRVLARSRDAERYIGTAIAPRPAAPRDVSASQVLAGPDGVPRFYGNAVIERGPWLLSVGIPTGVATARAAPSWRRNLGIIAAMIVVVLGLSLWLSHLLSGSLDRLRLAAQRIAAGDLSPPPTSPAPNREFGDLQDAFVTMAANLRAAHQALDAQVEQERTTREALQALQRQIVRQERLAAVGLLVSGVAHELNNPLQAILGTAELLERHPALPKEALDEIAFVKTQSGRAREIIRNLSRFSSQQPGPPAVIDLRDVIAEAVQLRRGDLDGTGISLDLECSSGRHVYANFTEIEQVTLNFVINAQQAIEAAGRQRGRILVRVSDSDGRVRVEVKDDGPGVPPQNEAKLFQPFFTTKPVGKGTGLGLSVSYGIIESYGGRIGHTNNDWGGATFYFELPAVNATPIGERDDRAPLLHRPIPSNL